ncbi:MAG TPA: helix-turn-helix domain-containing protein [Cellvibrionaceae bacterium]|nr:helix-turn-helix domain-containing protein [Cellvibrionaceae bacterium]HMW73577.1 helix-turn-helix domain-containing protein [Cellvibrionaceae bacterium]HMY39078.1 helix-turn-helix domain-containing protein [Marinagarivorans sp.]HNG60675.1 helix-turn-helix domain-containing protein [Cellvibrionaceae bacterium]
MSHTLTRWHRLLNYIDAHLEETLGSEQLCKLAHFSQFHFHRQFCAHFGVNLADYIQRVRFTQAAYLLAFRHQFTVTEIALMVGFNHPEVFSRAFKRWSNLTPSAFRAQPPWEFIHQQNTQLNQIRGPFMHTDTANYTVELIQFPTLSLAVLPHRGAPDQLGNSLLNFINWRKQHGLSPDKTRTFNIAYTPLDIEPQTDFRLDLAVELSHQVPLDHPDMERGTIAGGLCARIIHVGDDEGLEPAVLYLYGPWLSGHGYELRDAPLFLERKTFYPAVPMHLRETHIYLPLQEK